MIVALQQTSNTNLNRRIYLHIYYNKKFNFYIHIDIFKIIEACCYCLHTMQLHDAPFHFLIKVLQAFRFSAVSILKGRAFQIFGP